MESNTIIALVLLGLGGWIVLWALRQNKKSVKQ